MASIYVVVMGTLIGILTWIFLAFKVPGIPFGRTLGTLGGAILTLAFTVLSPADAFAAINLETIALLFGTMVMTILLEREGFFQHFVRILLYRCTTPFSLLARLCFAAGLLSALMTNDTVCVFFTPVIVELCELHQLPHGPFLIALATSANVGSTLTPVGNPQNMIIAALSGISYGDFILYIGPATVVSIIINIALLWLWYGKSMSGLEIRVSNTRFVRMTEEEMAALKGKDWEEQVRRQKEEEDRRKAERKKKDQESLDSQHGGLGEQLLELHGGGPSAIGSKAEEERERADRGYVPPGQLALHIRADNARQEERKEEETDKKDEADYKQQTAPAGDAFEAERMARQGAVDEEAKVDRDVERVEQKEQQEAVKAEATVAELPEEHPNSATQERLPPLLHDDSVAIVIHLLQKEQRRKEKEKRKGNNNGDQRNNQAAEQEEQALTEQEEEEEEEEQADLAHRKVKTRVADYNHPRKQGRLLVQLPPAVSTSSLVRLQRHQQRRRLREAKRATGMQPTSSEANVHASVDANTANDASLFTTTTASASSPFVCLAHCLPALVYARLLLIPLPSKLVCFTLILLGTVGAFAGGVNLGWAAVGGCAAMLVIDWRDPDRTLQLVDWPLLVFFTSLFVVTAGFSATDLPTDAWNALRPSIDVNSAAGVVLYSVIVIVGSNTVSNVPLVLLLGPSIPTLSNPQLSWLLLSYVSTVAGNLTLVGSVANLIVVSRSKSWYALSFGEYLRFGFPSTIVIGVVGVAIVKGMSTVV